MINSLYLLFGLGVCYLNDKKVFRFRLKMNKCLYILLRFIISIIVFRGIVYIKIFW